MPRISPLEHQALASALRKSSIPSQFDHKDFQFYLQFLKSLKRVVLSVPSIVNQIALSIHPNTLKHVDSLVFSCFQDLSLFIHPYFANIELTAKVFLYLYALILGICLKKHSRSIFLNFRCH
jgi:hypothetical protein